MLRPVTRTTAEWPAFSAALAEAGLPIEDLHGTGQQFFTLDGSPAFGGYFIAGQEALLRSIVVPSATRRRGMGRMLVAALLRQLEEQGVERTWLLTTTARPFFERLGFALADRSIAPAAIAATPQFSSLCPGSAAFMGRNLK